MRILIFLVMVSLLIVAYATSLNPDFPVESFKGNLTWSNINMSVESQPELGNALEYLVNGMGAALYEFMKWGAEFGNQNPELPYKALILLLIFAVLAPLILVAIKIVVLLIILIKDLIVSQKEKRELKQLRKGEQTKK